MKTRFAKVIVLSLLVLIMVSAFHALSGNAKRAKPTAPVDCSAIDDATLAANVMAKISATPSLKGQDIKVEAKAGVVTLRGTVSSTVMGRSATRTAASVSCVKRVTNALVIRKPFGPDGQCCCDGVCWQQTGTCPICPSITKCVEDYKAAVATAGGDKPALISARQAFEACKCAASVNAVTLDFASATGLQR